MKRLLCSFVPGMAILILGIAGPAQADPITYVQSGIATGTIGGSTFTNALVTLTMNGDTDNVVSSSEFEDDGEVIPAGLFFINVSSLTTVEIAGIGSASVFDPSAIYAFPTPVDIDEDGNIDPALVIFGTIDDPPVLESFTGLGGSVNGALAGYDLRTAFGPLTGSGGVGYPPSLSVNTSLGALRFASNIELSDESTFTATVRTPPVSVPEPGSLLLLGTGLVPLVGARSRFRGRRRTTSK